MDQRQIDIDNSMQNLGQHLRAGWLKENAANEKNIQVALEAVRDQWEKEQEASRHQPEHQPEKTSDRQPDGPDMER